MKYKRVSVEDAEQGWNEVYEASLDSCMHGMYCQQGADCQVRAGFHVHVPSPCSSVPFLHSPENSDRITNERTIRSAWDSVGFSIQSPLLWRPLAVVQSAH